MDMIIFCNLVKAGLNHTSGRANGPIQRMAIITTGRLRYHLSFSSMPTSLPVKSSLFLCRVSEIARHLSSSRQHYPSALEWLFWD